MGLRNEKSKEMFSNDYFFTKTFLYIYIEMLN